MPYLGANIFIHLMAGIWQNARLAALSVQAHFVLYQGCAIQFFICLVRLLGEDDYVEVGC